MDCGFQTRPGTESNVLKPKFVDGIVIFGTGSVDLAVILGAKSLGVQRVVVVAIQLKSLDQPKQTGATDLINSEEVDDVAAETKNVLRRRVVGYLALTLQY